MARHYAPSKKKKLKLPTLSSLRVPALPKLLGRDKKNRAARSFEREFTVRDMLFDILATILFMVGLMLQRSPAISTLLFALAAGLALTAPFLSVLQSLFSRKMPDEDMLVILAVVLAFCIGEGMAGAIAAILYHLMQILEAYTQTRGAAALDQVRDKLPDKAMLMLGGEIHEVMPETVEPGQIVRVLPGETLPLDGKIVSGVTEMDQSALTGNSNGRRCGVGDEVFSGSVNRGDRIDVEVTRPFSEGAFAYLLRNVEESSRYETTPERLSKKIAVWLAPCIAALALLIILVPSLITGNWTQYLRIGVIFLLLSSPSSLIISITTACTGAELSAVLQGILSKGHDCFEILSQVKTMVFGKTGTITEGYFEITEVFGNGISKEDLVDVAAAAESFSNHPIAQLLKAAANWNPEIGEGVMKVEEIPGRGVSAFLEGRHVYVGNASLMQDHDIRYKVPSHAGAAVHVAVENRYWGHILVSDKTRDGAFDALEALRSEGVNQLVMLTGDVMSSSRPLAASLGFDLMRTELGPKEKVSAIQYLISGQGRGSSVGFVGDGINDAPMLQAADVGITVNALQAWRDAEDADILLMDSKIELLPAAMRISRILRRIIWENFALLTSSKLVLLVLGLVGVVSIPMAAVLSTSFSAIALFNSFRAFGLK